MLSNALLFFLMFLPFGFSCLNKIPDLKVSFYTLCFDALETESNLRPPHVIIKVFWFC